MNNLVLQTAEILYVTVRNLEAKGNVRKCVFKNNIFDNVF